MSEEVKRILQMVKDGKLSPEDAAELLDAFDAGTAADAGAGTGTTKTAEAEPQQGTAATGETTDDKDPFKSFIEAIERISKEASGSVNWQDVGKHVQEGARKGVEALRSGLDQVSKGKVAFPWGGIQETREVTLPLSVPQGKTLKVDNACGDVKIVGGFDRGSATARARFRGTPEDAKVKADSYTLIIEESEHMILIRQPDVVGLSVDVEIQMPGKGPVEVKSTSGNVQVMDTGGSLRVDGVSGNISIKGLNGAVEISATSGNVQIEDVSTPSLALENKAGNVMMRRVKGNVNARTSAGNMLLEDCSGKTLSIESVSGDVSVDITEPVNGTVNLRTVSGNAKVTMDGGDCRVSLSTLRGAVNCDLQLQDESRTAQRVSGRVGDGTGTLDVSAVTGNISVVLRDHKV